MTVGRAVADYSRFKVLKRGGRSYTSTRNVLQVRLNPLVPGNPEFQIETFFRYISTPTKSLTRTMTTSLLSFRARTRLFHKLVPKGLAPEIRKQHVQTAGRRLQAQWRMKGLDLLQRDNRNLDVKASLLQASITPSRIPNIWGSSNTSPRRQLEIAFRISLVAYLA